jgi:hypothetical protein
MHFRTRNCNNISGIGTSDTTCAKQLVSERLVNISSKNQPEWKYMQTIYAQIQGQDEWIGRQRTCAVFSDHTVKFSSMENSQ